VHQRHPWSRGGDCWVAPKGVCYVERLVLRIEDPAEELPEAVLTTLKVLAELPRTLDEQILVLNAGVWAGGYEGLSAPGGPGEVIATLLRP
jgi:hypothetical protein